MGRTESKTVQVAPAYEQFTIEKMQKFGWSLQNAQDVKTVDNHLERKGNDIYQVTEKEHYVKLLFQRDLDMPNLGMIRKLEEEYDALIVTTDYVLLPKWFIAIAVILFIISFSTATVVDILMLIGVVGGYAAYFLYIFKPRKEKNHQEQLHVKERKEQIYAEVAQYL